MFKVIEDKFAILECLKTHLTPSYMVQYSLEDQITMFGCRTILSSISPVSFNYFYIFFKMIIL